MFNNLLKKQKQKLEQQLQEIDKTIEIKVSQNNELNFLIIQAKDTLSQLEQNIANSKQQLEKYQHELGITEGVIAMQELGIEYNPTFHNLDDIACKKKSVQKAIGELIGSGEAIITTRVYRIDGSEAKGKQFQKTFCENLLIGFNYYFNQKKKAVNSTNIVASKDLITKKFSVINKKASLMGVAINQKYLDLCLELLTLELEEKLRKTEEKERIKEERRRLKEQEKLLAEAEKERKKLEEERHNLQKLFAKAITEQEQEDIKNKLAEVDKRTEEIDWRINHQSAGWLYIATTPCLEGMYKAGCTKQLNPLNRLAQLSSASVPYPFECRGLVFSEDVFDLEAKLHQRLSSTRVNKENRNKEFFYGEPEEAIKILQDEFGVEVHFVDESWVEEE